MYKDNRGYLLFPIKDNKYMDKITTNISKDCTYSINKKNVFRGLHINSFGKLITCITGNFIDIMVNMDTLEVKYYNIKPGDQVYCPGGFGHGFICLEDNSVLSYHCEGFFGNEVGGLLNYKDPVLNIQLPVSDTDIIINEKDSGAPFLEFDYFLLGHNGYIGNTIYNELKKQNKKVLALKQRMEDIKNIKKLIEVYKPKYFINAAGLTGFPNTSWCNTHKKETLMTNVINQINILNLCSEYNLHCTIIGSGAIFNNSNNIKYSNDKGDLDDENNYYSHCRILLENMVEPFNNCLLLRVNYPLSNNFNNPKNLINKIVFKYQKLENIFLSVTNLDSMCSIIPDMIENRETGVFNFVNKEQINIVDLFNIINNKYNLSDNRKEIIQNNSSRQSIKLYPDKLEKYNIENIYDSVKKL